MKMSGNTILITGGTSGIGYSLADQFLKRGNTVIVTGRTEARLAAARQSLPGVHAYVSDVSEPQAISTLCADVTKDFPGLNVLINNAGIGLKRDLNDPTVDLDDLAREIRTNLIGPIQMIRQFLPHLKRQPSATIVNVSSGLAFVPMPVKPIYCATKAALHSYTQSLRVQLKSSGVKVVELVPPAVKTEFNRDQEDMNARGFMDVTKFAVAAMHGLESGRDEVLPGLSPILRTLGRLLPGMTIRRGEAERMVAANRQTA